MQFAIAVLWLISSLMAATAYGDTRFVNQKTGFAHSSHDKIDTDAQCTDLGAGNSLCAIRTELQYRKYLAKHHMHHDPFASSNRNSEPPGTNLMAVFKLALEEFNLLSGVRIYWEYTERNIRELAVKLKLRGEIAITDPYDGANGPTLQQAKGLKPPGRRKPTPPGGISAVFIPQTIRWNLGLNPEDLAMFAELYINPHISLSGRIGDEDQIGLYVRYAF
jgi:hypothetical protein